MDGMSKDGTRDIVENYARQYPFIHLLNNEKRIVPIAMNIGIKVSKGDVIMRLDAHAQYPANYFSVLVKALETIDADNVGAACRTDVLNKTPKTLAIGEVLSNKFGVGNSTFRLGVDKVMEVDTVPFGCWKREVFDKYGVYDERLIRNQDIELNKRIVRGGGHIYIVPDTYCVYLARETFKGLAKNNYGNGKWNVLTVYYTKQMGSLSLRHFIPLLFLLSLIVPLFCSLIWSSFVFVTIVSLLAYLLTLGGIGMKLTISKRLSFGYLLISFFVLHVSYGWGSLNGIISVLKNGR